MKETAIEDYVLSIRKLMGWHQDLRVTSSRGQFYVECGPYGASHRRLETAFGRLKELIETTK